MIDDLFEPAAEDPEYGVRAGRYRFPSPPGVPDNPRGWMRMTNLVSAFSDQKALQDWIVNKIMHGLRENDGLLMDEWMAEPLHAYTEDEARSKALAFAEKAKDAAGGGDAARRGTARHLMMSSWFEDGTRNGTRAMLLQLEDVREILDAAELDVFETEVPVWHPAAGGTMGRLDARVLCRRTGQVGTLDWKTQARFWTWQEIAGQLYGYDSASWEWSGAESREGHWVPSEHFVGRWDHPITWPSKRQSGLLGHPDGDLAGKPVALVMHMPLAGRPELHEVDLRYGKAVLETAARNVELRSIGRSTAVGRRPAGVRPR